MLRSRFRYCLALVFCAVFSFSFLLVPSTSIANAMSDSWYPPTCEANFGETATASLSSKSTLVTYSEGSARLTTTYKFTAATPTTLSCSLPVYCRQYEVSTCGASLSLNGVAATPTYGYSFKSTFMGSDSYAEILALREKQTTLDNTLPVHTFSISATEEAEFSFSLQPDDHLIYKFGRHTYYTANRLYEVKVSPNMPCYFIVFGNKPTVDASEQCTVTYTQKTISEYIAEATEFMTQMANGVDCSEIVTHWVMNYLASDSLVREDRMIDECGLMSYAFLDYSLALPVGESTIVIEQPMAVGLNSLYEPKVYVGNIFSPAQTAPLSFSVDTEQYVVDSTLALNNNSYSGNAVEAVTIAFCAVKSPNLVNPPSVVWEPWRIAVVSVCGVVGVAAVIILVITTVQYIKSRKHK